jgi:hypothetical protein
MMPVVVVNFRNKLWGMMVELVGSFQSPQECSTKKKQKENKWSLREREYQWPPRAPTRLTLRVGGYPIRLAFKVARLPEVQKTCLLQMKRTKAGLGGHQGRPREFPKPSKP